MHYPKINNKAQNFIEYTLILGIIGVALFSMQTYFKRGVQSLVKVTADDLGPQGEHFKDEFKLIEKEKLDQATQNKYGYANKYTYNNASFEDITIKNEGEGKISRKTNRGSASSFDESY